MNRTRAARLALALSVMVAWSALSETLQPCADEVGLIDACQLCPCCATTVAPQAQPLAMLAPLTRLRAMAPVVVPSALDAPAPPTPPPIALA